MTAQTLTNPERTGFVKRYPRAVVRIARPTAGRPVWGPMWRAWVLDANGEIVRDEYGRPEDLTMSSRTAALEDATRAVGIARHLRNSATARAGGRR